MIQIIETKDYHLLSQLNEEIQTFHHRLQPNIFKPYEQEQVNEFFKTVLNKENTKAYLAWENEIPIGYILLFNMKLAENPFQYSRSFVLLDQILVLKKYRGKGIGKILLDAAISYAKDLQIDLIELNHWTHNASARTFFTKNNFQYYNEKMWRSIP